MLYGYTPTRRWIQMGNVVDYKVQESAKTKYGCAISFTLANVKVYTWNECV